MMDVIANDNFVTYTFKVGGSRERYDLIYSIIEKFHQDEPRTILIRDDSENTNLEEMSFAVYSILSADEYDADLVDLQVRAALDVLKLRAVFECHKMKVNPLTVYGATLIDFYYMKLFSMKGEQHSEYDKDYFSVTFGDDEGEFDLNELGFHNFEHYYSSEGVESIRAILEEHKGDDEMDKSYLEYWFENDIDPISNIKVKTYMKQFKTELKEFDAFFK